MDARQMKHPVIITRYGKIIRKRRIILKSRSVGATTMHAAINKWYDIFSW